MKGRFPRRPIAPFGDDLWRDVALAVDAAQRLGATVEPGVADIFVRDPAPYLWHIRDRIQEHRRAELRRIELELGRPGVLLRRAIEDIDRENG